mgnify:CR=1 FL=1
MHRFDFDLHFTTVKMAPEGEVMVSTPKVGLAVNMSANVAHTIVLLLIARSPVDTPR